MSSGLNIALFIGALEPGPTGGTAHYTARLLTSLADDPGPHRYTLLAQNNLSREAIDYYSKAAGPGMKWQFYDAHPFRAQYTNLLQYLHAQNPGHKKAAWAARHLLPENRMLARRSYELIYSPSQELPCFRPSIPTLLTLHDVQELHFPLFFDASERVRRGMRNYVYAAAGHHFVVSYEHVKHDLIRAYGLGPERIHVLPHAHHKEVQEQEADTSTILPVEFANAPFMLYPAQTWQHKNHLGLVKALSLAIKQQPGMTLNLVCTGGLNEHYARIVDEIRSLGLESRVHFTGFIPRSALISLYRRAAFVMIPTLYEAGSFPLLEAFQLGVPAVCSNVTSLPETMGSQDYLFDPKRVEEMAGMILRMGTDSIFREGNRQYIQTKAKAIEATAGVLASDYSRRLKSILALAADQSQRSCKTSPP